MIPDFDSDGRLPPGIHSCDWQEFSSKFAWNPHRNKLMSGLKAALDSLKYAGCQTIYIDGSFVTAKEIPGDFDACWEVQGVDPNFLDPVLLIFDKGRAAQKAKYFGELFPAECVEGTSGKTFLDFFAVDKDTGTPKGIVVIDLMRGL
jgi:Family of unknown function (DUF6932)